MVAKNQSIDSDISVFEAAFKEYFPILVIHAHHILEDADEAKDIVQNVFVAVLAKKTAININLKGYMYTAVHNKCLHALAARKRKESGLRSWKSFADNPVFNYPGEKEQLPNLELLLKAVPPQRQKALMLVFYNKLPYKVAAEKMGISLNSLKTHLKLGLSQLRNTLLTR